MANLTIFLSGTRVSDGEPVKLILSADRISRYVAIEFSSDADPNAEVVFEVSLIDLQFAAKQILQLNLNKER